MKKLAAVVFGFLLSNSVLADYKADILDLCSIAKKGNFSQIQAKGQLQADGSVKLATLGGKGEVSFSKGSWEGIQQVLKEHQATDNVTARDCVIKLMPYFKSKVTATKPQISAMKKAPPAAVAKPVIPSTEKSSSHCTIEGDQDVCGNTTGGDMNINFGAKP